MKRYRAIVIGSGAGGAPAAARLAKAWGSEVALLEAGAFYRASDFNQLEREMLPKLYAGKGLQATEDGAIGVLQGQLVGGSTVINDALCFRPPPEIVDRWSAYGVDIDMDTLNGWADTVEARMGTTQIPKSMINRSNYLVGLGAARLGWKGERLRHNSVGCVQCGFRHIGCAYRAKQSMNLTYVQDALDAGAVLHDETRVEALTALPGGRWRVSTENEEYEADVVVVAAGVVQTPALLLRSGIPAGEGLQFHLQTVAYGDFNERVDGFAGIPMSYGVMEFADIYGHQGPGYLIEGVNVQPSAFGVHVQAEWESQEATVQRYPFLAGAVSLVRASGRGRVELGKNGRPQIHHPLDAHDAGRLEDFYVKATEMFLAAGASRVLLGHRQTRWVTRLPRLDEVRVTPGQAYVYTAHPFGGATRGGTLDGVGQVKGQPNLWVLDASAFPEALGVNPQITIASLSLEGADRILGGFGVNLNELDDAKAGLTPNDAAPVP